MKNQLRNNTLVSYTEKKFQKRHWTISSVAPNHRLGNPVNLSPVVQLELREPVHWLRVSHLFAKYSADHVDLLSSQYLPRRTPPTETDFLSQLHYTILVQCVFQWLNPVVQHFTSKLLVTERILKSYSTNPARATVFRQRKHFEYANYTDCAI